LKDQVRAAFAESMKVLWAQVMTEVAAIGLSTALKMKELPLQKVTDEDWGLRKTVGERGDNSGVSS
jgi:uncharacterized Zn finger protein